MREIRENESRTQRSLIRNQRCDRLGLRARPYGQAFNLPPQLSQSTAHPARHAPQIDACNAKLLFLMKKLSKVARVTGLEPATSGVTGRRSNQLSYTRSPLGTYRYYRNKAF